MIKVTQERDNIYTVEFDAPELNLLYKIAAGFQIPRTEAIKSVISRGLDSTVAILHEIAEHEKRTRESVEQNVRDTGLGWKVQDSK